MLSLRYVLVSLALLALAWPARAQDTDWQRFYPLEIGDTWTYEVAFGPEDGPIRLTHYLRRTVLRDTVLEGEAYRLVRVDSLSKAKGHPVLADALCAVRVLEETGTVAWLPVDVTGGATCFAPEAAYELDLRAGTSAANSLYLNTRFHAFEAVETWGGSGNPTGTPSFQASSDLGLADWRSDWSWQYDDRDRTMMRVVYAVVGGEEYGLPIDSEEWRAFYPLNEGDIYEYRFFEYPRSRYVRWDVEEETVIDGEAYQLVRQRQFDLEFQLLSERVCAMRAEEGRVRLIPLGEGGPYPCVTFLKSWMDLRSNTWTVRVAEAGLEKLFVDNERGFLVDRTHIVEGIGVTRYDLQQNGRPGGGYLENLRLLYAVVDGEPYGSPVIPVPTEGEAVPLSFAFVSAFPNPFSASTTLTLSLRTPEPVTLSVFDVLGRRVLRRALGVQPAGESRHVLDGSGLPAGVYVVRATTDSGAQATRRVVRVE